jgi:hypothetical protein
MPGKEARNGTAGTASAVYGARKVDPEERALCKRFRTEVGRETARNMSPMPKIRDGKFADCGIEARND